VHEELAKALQQGHGIVTAKGLELSWPLKNAVRAGRLVRLFPGVYVDARSNLEELRHRAAMRYLAGTEAAFSHLTALQLWDLRRQPVREPLHVTVSPGTRLRNGPGLRVHRSVHHAEVRKTWRYGVPVFIAAQAIVDAWPLLPADRVGIVLRAIEQRIAFTRQIRAALKARPATGGAFALTTLLTQIDEGCRSQLEIWGMLWIFSGPEMPAFKRQFPVRVRGHVYYLDVYAEEERVAFELDGAAFHGSKSQREADLVRDAALATRGIRVVRYAYSRLMAEPEAVRREVLKILRAARS
jgi:hypothetical protein